MGAMKRLHGEYGRSGWDLTGFPKEERPHWRRLLPAERSTPTIPGRYELTFGKHRGRMLEQVAAIGQSGSDYLAWLDEQRWLSEDLRKALTEFLATLSPTPASPR